MQNPHIYTVKIFKKKFFRSLSIILLSTVYLFCKELTQLRVLIKFLLLNIFQSSSNSSSILEAAKRQDIGLPRAFSFCYQQEIESTKQTGGSRNKALPEQVWIKVGGR